MAATIDQPSRIFQRLGPEERVKLAARHLLNPDAPLAAEQEPLGEADTACRPADFGRGAVATAVFRALAGLS